MAGFHDILFPLPIALGARGGPERRTDIVATASGREERNARWAHARRRYDVGSAIRTLADLETVLAFFEERRGRLYGFRWRDRLDFKSCPLAAAPAPADQTIGLGDGVATAFRLTKLYGGAHAPYRRDIAKPVAASLRVAVQGVEVFAGVDFDLDATTGTVTFRAGHAPAAGAAVTTGFEFDVPVRFDVDRLEIDLSAFDAGHVPSIPLVEIIP
ncbi:MAG: DUF2460 domain-containing protein [Methylobacteriaceae bacterium]|nr:DUF2460 domain-containing protein [Methylobacteriaceae bacterium]